MAIKEFRSVKIVCNKETEKIPSAAASLPDNPHKPKNSPDLDSGENIPTIARLELWVEPRPIPARDVMMTNIH